MTSLAEMADQLKAMAVELERRVAQPGNAAAIVEASWARHFANDARSIRLHALADERGLEV